MVFPLSSYSAPSVDEINACDCIAHILSSAISNSDGDAIVESLKRFFKVADKKTYYDILKITKKCTTTPKEQVRILTCSYCKHTMITCRVFCPYCLLFHHRPTYLVKGCNNAKCLANTRVNGVIESLEGNVKKCATAFCNHVRRSATYGEVYYNHPISIIGDLISSGLFFELANTKRSEIMDTIRRCREGNLISSLTCANTISVFAGLGEKQLADAALQCLSDVRVPGASTESLASGLIKAATTGAVEKRMFKATLPIMNDEDRKQYKASEETPPHRVNSLEIKPSANEGTHVARQRPTYSNVILLIHSRYQDGTLSSSGRMILPDPYEDANTKSFEEARKITKDDVLLFLREDLDEYEKYLEETAKSRSKKQKPFKNLSSDAVMKLDVSLKRRNSISQLLRFKESCMDCLYTTLCRS